MLSYILTGVSFIFIIGVLVIAHELGHYTLAKKAGMKVEEFGFGLPPRLIGKKKWGTLFTLNAIPLGGFVRVKGGDTFTVTEKELNDPENYHSKTWWQRFWFISAGVIMNLILAIILLSFGYMIGMMPLPGTDLYDSSIKEADGIYINQVVKDSPAESVGLEQGDIIKFIGGKSVTSLEDFTDIVKNNIGKDISITIDRDGIENTYYVKPENNGKIGVSIQLMLERTEVKLPIHKAVYYATLNTFFIAKQTALGLIKMVGNIITGFSIPAEVSGPVGIVSITHQVVNVGFVPFIQFMAILSISLAVLNIFPFPALDGGRLLFLFVEAIMRKRVNAAIENYIHAIGFALLMLMIIAVTYKDILDLF